MSNGVKTIDLGFRPRLWQEAILAAFRRFNILVIHRRAGKTRLAIMKLIDSALKHGREMGRFGYIAPKRNQAKDIVWEVLKFYALKIPGTTANESELYVQFPNGARVSLYGADDPNKLRGLYFDGVVIDEVAQMPLELWGEILVPSLSDAGRLGWALFIGTPQGINLFSDIYYKALNDPEWYAKLQTVHETGVFTEAEIRAIREKMTDAEFRQEYLCDFGASTENAIIPIADVRAAMDRILQPEQYQFAPRILGVDVAWTGGDRCVIFKRQGLMSYEPIIRKGLPEKTFAAEVARVWRDWRADACFVDTTGGYGGEVVGRLRDLGYSPQEVKFSWKDEERFVNMRAQMWWKMREWIRGGAQLPRNEGLIAELSAPTYTLDNAANKIQLESKDDIKARLGFSPDIADAACLTHAFPVQQREIMEVHRTMVEEAEEQGGKSSGPGEWDPFRW